MRGGTIRQFIGEVIFIIWLAIVLVWQVLTGHPIYASSTQGENEVKRIPIGLFILVFLVVILPMSVFAASWGSQDIPTDLPSLVAQFTALAGVAAFFAMLINVGKVIGVVQDTTASVWTRS